MVQGSSSKYNFFKYDSADRWMSYWHQILEVLKLNPVNALEIGIGNKTVSNYLKNQGIKVTTLDINERLEPNVVGNVLEMPFEDNSFDAVLCAEVLEHLPFEEFEKALSELKRVSREYVVLTLPHYSHPIKFSYKMPLLKEIKFAIRIPGFKKHKFDGEHYWQIGKRGYSLKKIKRIIKRCFRIRKDFISFEKQSHHFFLLEK